jgi:hypothetical protein
MRGIVRAVAVGLGLIAGAALIPAPAVAQEKVRYKIYRQNPSAWYWFGPPGRGEHIALKARVAKRGYYIGPHYRSDIAPGYHTNGPGIGIMK